LKFSLSWLREHLDTDASLEDLVSTLNNIGLEVESVGTGTDLPPCLVVSRIVSAEPHSKADRLTVCHVDIGEVDTVQVVCGATNARPGLKTVFAPPGTELPEPGFIIGVRSIRGVKSKGMLCSRKELRLMQEGDPQSYEEEIIELPDTAPVGTSYASLTRSEEDVVFKIAITPNRADCASVRGVARDLAAASLGSLKNPPVYKVDANGIPLVQVHIEESLSTCSRYIARCVTGLKNQASPSWMQRRLFSAGLQSVSAVVDVANYVMLDRGQPMHIFDADNLSGDLCLRNAMPGEELLALDGKTYSLGDQCCVIADDTGPVAIAGIIGGIGSSCSLGTRNILIECANFDPINIAEAGYQLNISSEARYRFERGIDPEGMEASLDHATKMILDICGGVPRKEVDILLKPQEKKTIIFPLSEVERLSGLRLSHSEITDIIEGLGCSTLSIEDSVIQVFPPSWRMDLSNKADLVEEVVRIHGIDKIPLAPLHIHLRRGTGVVSGTDYTSRSLISRVLAGRGMMEAVTWSFISEEHAREFSQGAEELPLANPISEVLSYMRPSLLPGLLNAVKANDCRRIENMSVFEVGQVFRGRSLEDQVFFASGIRRGTGKEKCAGRHWRNPAKEVTFAEAKGDALAALTGLGCDTEVLNCVRSTPVWYHPGRSASLQCDSGVVLAVFGELHPSLLQKFDISGPVVAFEINLSSLRKYLPTSKAKGALRVNPFGLLDVHRDYAFVLDEEVEAGRLIEAIKNADPDLISQVTVFDVFRNPAIGTGKKSMAVNVVITPTTKTLTDSELEGISSKIIESAAVATGAVLR